MWEMHRSTIIAVPSVWMGFKPPGLLGEHTFEIFKVNSQLAYPVGAVDINSYQRTRDHRLGS
jgi:hypothetical protein